MGKRKRKRQAGREKLIERMLPFVLKKRSIDSKDGKNKKVGDTLGAQEYQLLTKKVGLAGHGGTKKR